MDQNPKKSKALLITIIAIIVLLGLLFFFLRSKTQETATKGSTGSTNKIFSSLFGSSKQKQTVAIGTTAGKKDATIGTPTAPTTATDTKTQTGSFGNTGGIGAGSFAGSNGLNTGAGFGDTGTNSVGSYTSGSFGSIMPVFSPLPTPGNTPIRTTPTPQTDIPSLSTPTTDTPEQGFDVCKDAKGKSVPCTIGSTPVEQETARQVAICQQDPLVFTQEEQTKIDELLRKYYFLAGNLKNDEDLLSIEADTNDYILQLERINDHIQECEAQTADPKYTGPKMVRSNPYYKGPKDDDTYLPGEPAISVSGNQNNGSWADWTSGGDGDTKWTLSLDFKSYERALNIW